ncbi:hypothetical protein BCR43DRAFT_482508 [Syncephalastrum racemosum]|uniref:Uncharacterized protein n=1 Tax=Syncephalastrum racemosum TaxID=13706 RepID=A0A1X2HV60_SYNRA|nr:hypothetical protein BCR43DRAFT_482508 [Syncephalastrum racemosum]
MSFHTYDASLPYVEALHSQTALDALIASLSNPTETLSVREPPKTVNDPTVDALKQISNLQLTANGAWAHKSTLDACLDLYYQLGVNTDTEHVHSLLAKAWAEDSEATLHIIWHTRSIHRGKSANTRFYVAFMWLLKHHPQTALRNLSLLVSDAVEVPKKQKKSTSEQEKEWEIIDTEKQAIYKSHGYWKDLANILTIYANDEVDGPQGESGQFKALNWPRQPFKGNSSKRARAQSRVFYSKLKTLPEEEKANKLAERRKTVHERHEKLKADQREATMRRRAEQHARINKILSSDKTYQALHATVARMFATQLQEDLKRLEENKQRIASNPSSRAWRHALGEGLSLAAKWAPSLAHSHDKFTRLATSIAEVMYPPAEYMQKEETRSHYINKVREQYRRNVISPLREALDVTERRMHGEGWKTIDFTHVPSQCMALNAGQFFLHAKEEFMAYLEDVASGTKSISGATLQPHQLVKPVREMRYGASGSKRMQNILAKLEGEAKEEYIRVQSKIYDAQWQTLVESLRADPSVNLGSAIAVCDTSGSMMGAVNTPIIPMDGSIGLSLLIAELAQPPFGDILITFDEEPSVVNVERTKSFSERCRLVLDAAAGYNTNFLAVFVDLLLPLAKRHNIAKEDMVKRLYVFSDMEFDGFPGNNEWETTYERIKTEYSKTGYDVPELVWWNLAGVRPFDYDPQDAAAPAPVTKEEKGCAMLCGYSAALMKTFLEGNAQSQKADDVIALNEEEEEEENKPLNPLSTMKEAIGHESFKDLVVVD